MEVLIDKTKKDKKEETPYRVSLFLHFLAVSIKSEIFYILYFALKKEKSSNERKTFILDNTV